VPITNCKDFTSTPALPPVKSCRLARNRRTTCSPCSGSATAPKLWSSTGRDGEFGATLHPEGKKSANLKIGVRTREQPERSRLDFLFAPLKVGRLEYLVQKATEMGVNRITPVFTDHTQLHKVNSGRLAANILEAAEQCGNLAIPELGEALKLETLLSDWNPARRIIFCNESQAGNNPAKTLHSIKERDLALLVGPEGGFSERERGDPDRPALHHINTAGTAYPSRRHGCGGSPDSGSNDHRRLVGLPISNRSSFFDPSMKDFRLHGGPVPSNQRQDAWFQIAPVR
jgi:hypothetical protein